MSNIETKGEQNIVYIDVDKIYPHPNNPRKELGDITELADSIKANGILQNLTVVPHPGAIMNREFEECYMAVIGHRRHAAAKQAGLKKVPCTISDMDEKAQVSTMLQENMQRSDLTVIEEAEGLQMMMDMGETIENIAAKTGFSQTTIRRRTNLLKLDRKKLEQSTERGATLEDYAKLEKIKNSKTRNKLLEVIGTNNFNMKLENELRDEKRKENKPKVLKVLKGFAAHHKGDRPPQSEYVAHIDFADGATQFKKPKDADKREYFFTDTYGDSGVYLYRKVEKQTKSEKEQAAEKEKRQRKRKLNEVTRQAFALREQFVAGYAGSKKDLPAIHEFLMKSMFDGYGFRKDKFFEFIGISTDHDDYRYTESMAKVLKKLLNQPEKILLKLAWQFSGDHKDEGYFSTWEMKHNNNRKLDDIYKCLEAVGYQMSDDEKALQNGTHKLLVKPNKPKEEAAGV